MPLYRALLRLFPAGFRHEYGGEMEAIFAERLAGRSISVQALLWLEAVADIAWHAAAAHFDLLRQDVGFAMRSFRRSPGFALIAIAVAAVGIGATTAVFTVTDHVLIRPLPFPEPNRIVKLWQDLPGYSQMEASPANYDDWRRMARSFSGMSAFTGVAANLSGEAEPRRLQGAAATVDFFAVLGVDAEIGRVFARSDGDEDAPQVLLLSYDLWQTAFGGSEDVLGTTVILDQRPLAIVGVMPAHFRFPWPQAEYWTTLRFIGDEPALDQRTNNALGVVARLAPGVSVEEAQGEMDVISGQLREAYPVDNANTGANVFRLRDEIYPPTRRMLTALMAAAFAVLLVACLNLASLLLARALARRRELAVRSSLGAGPERITRQILTESVCLSLAGATAGTLLAYLSLPVFDSLVRTSLPLGAPEIDLRVLALAVALSVGTGLLFGVVPALRASGTGGALGERTQTGGGSGRQRIRSALVFSEVAISVVLLVCVGLLLQALGRVSATDPGFRSDDVLTLRTALSQPKYASVADRSAFLERILERVQALPGVESAGYTSFLPIAMGGGVWPVSLTEEVRDRAASHSASLRFVTPGYIEALDIPLIQGRQIRASDRQDAPYVALISQSLAERHWPGQNPIGQRFSFGLAERTVVGVVGDIRNRGLERSSEPQVYLPHAQVPDGWLTYYAPKDLAIRTDGDIAGLAPAVRAIIREADPEQPVTDVQTLDQVVRAGSAGREAQLRILVVFAAAALLLAGIGIHGLLSFGVSTRTREFGVRMAIGATPRSILALVLRQGMWLALGGVIAGTAGAYAAGRAIESLLAGVDPAQIQTFAVVGALVLLIALLGSLRPALRAVRIDPNSAIRSE